MAEKKAEIIYNNILKIVEDVLGNDITDSFQLMDVGEKLFGDRFIGVFSSDEVPIMENGTYCIVNVDPSGMSGSHWMGLCKDNNEIYIYDSFGRDDEKIIPALKKSGNGKVKDSDKDVEQQNKEKNCGARSMAWLCLVHWFGLKKALLI